MRQRRRKGLTLLEVIFSMAIFAVALMGVSSAYVVVERSQQMTKERFAATLAAQTMLDEIQNYVDLNQTGYPGNLDTLAPGGSYNRIGFHVYLASSETGADRGLMGAAGGIGTAGSGNFLKPGAAALFPASRGLSLFTDVATYAGYIEVTTPEVARPELRLVTVTIAWKTFGQDTSINVSTLVGPKVG